MNSAMAGTSSSTATDAASERAPNTLAVRVARPTKTTAAITATTCRLSLFVLFGSVDAIAELLYLGGDVDAAAAEGSIVIDGDAADVVGYTRLFGLPEPAPTA